MRRTGELPRLASAGRALLAATAAAIALAAVTTSASGATWNVDKLPDPSVQASLYGASCPTTSLCVAVGANSTVASSTNPAAGGRSWRVGRPGGSVVIPEIPGVPGGGEPIFAGAQIRGVSCPSSSLCVAVSFDGRVYFSQNPAGGPATWNAVPLSEPKKPNHHMGGISCPAVDFCVAVAYGGRIIVTGAPTGDRSAWVVTQLPVPYDLRGVSCPTPSFCVAVGNEGEVLTSRNPAGGVWQLAGNPLGLHSMNGVACPSAELCVVGSAGGVAVSTDPGAGVGSWRVVSPGTGLPIKALSCPTTTACAAIDNNADFLHSTRPASGSGSWTFENVVSYGAAAPGAQGNGMFGLSCPATNLCVAVGQDSQVLTTTDPFAEASTGPGKGMRKRRGKRPRVRITRHPAKRLEHRKGGVRVTFHFRAIGKAKRFQCRTGKRKRYRTCRSPVRYRVGGGKHAFRVRAIGRRGVKGPPETFHFRVGRLTERPPYGSCPPGIGPSAPSCIPNPASAG